MIDVDSECILNDDQIATIDHSHHDAVVVSGADSVVPQVRCSLCWIYLSV